MRITSGRGLSFLKRFLVLILLVALSLAILSPDVAEAARKKSRKKAAAPQPDRYAAIVVDSATGYVLSEKNADVRRYPASLTKMMTLYLTFEALQAGTLTKNQRLPVSANAQYQSPSKLGLEAGYSLRVEDAIYALVTRSANDAAVVLAEGIGGSEERFARLMTFKAQQLGMKASHFVNASGLHDTQQYSTARDMAILCQSLIRDFPREYRYFSTPSFVYAGVTSMNHNKLLATYPGMDGIKTGYVYASGYNLAASAVQNGRRVTALIFGGRTSASRNSAMVTLLDNGFARLKDPRVAALIAQRQKMLAAKMPKKKPLSPSSSSARNAKLALAASEPEGQGDSDESLSGGRVNGFTSEFRPRPINQQRLDTAGTPTPNVTAYTPSAQQNYKPAAQPRTSAYVVQKPVAPMVRPVAKPVMTNASGKPQQQPANFTSLSSLASAPGGTGAYAVQIGAFSSHDAGMMALKTARESLPQKINAASRYVIAPLKTNRGMIYRARLAGLSEGQATQACQTLRGSCLVMTAQ
ncbi:MAG: serine hydrolase [Alphaproteobacteria bacterium]